MDCFTFLGIEKTTDKEIITNAYRSLIPKYHPEDDPKGFQNLRKAYEDALNYEEVSEEIEEDLSETGIWVAKVRDLYDDFAKRLDINNWQLLLEDDVVYSLDTKNEANKKLLEFIMDHFYLPFEVWKLLGTHFNWTDIQSDLYEQFPPNFIDYILNNLVNEPSIRFDLFEIEKDKDYEAFIRNYFTISNNVDYKEEKENIYKTFQEMEQTGIYHPDVETLKVRFYLNENNLETAKQIAYALLKRFPDSRTYYAIARVHMHENDYETAKEYAKKVLDIDERNVGSMLVIADADFALKHYETALLMYEKAKEVIKNYRYIEDMVARCHQEICIDTKKQVLKGTDEEKFKFVKSALEGYMSKELLEIGNTINPKNVDAPALYLDLSEACFRLNNSDKTKDYIKRGLEYCKKGLDVSTNDTDSCLLLAQKGTFLSEENNFNEAIECFDKAIELDNSVHKPYYKKAAVLNKMGEYKEAIKYCDMVLDKEEVPNALHFKAEALYHMGYFKDCMEYCDKALAIVPYLATYKIKLNVYFEHSMQKEFYDLLNYLYDIKLVDDEVELIKLKGEVNSRNFDEASKLVDELLKKDPQNKAVYYQKALLDYDLERYVDAYNALEKSYHDKIDKLRYEIFKANIIMMLGKRTESRKIFETLIKDNMDNVSDVEYFYSRIAYSYVLDKDINESINCYKKALEINPESDITNRKIADLLYDERRYDEAIEYGKAQLKNFQSEYDFVNMGIFYEAIEDTEKEREAYLQGLEFDPKMPYALNNLAWSYFREGQIEKAHEYYKRAFEAEHPESYMYSNYYNCLMKLEKYEEALVCVEAAMERFPDNDIFMLRKSFILQELCYYDKAIENMEEYGKKFDKTVEALQEIGDIYELKKDYKKAEEFYNKAIAVNKPSLIDKIKKAGKESPEPYFYIGFFYQKTKEYQKAIKAFLKAIELDDEDGDYFVHLAEIYEKLGDKAKKQKYAKKALNIYKNNFASEGYPNACNYHELGNALRLLGDLESSEDNLKKAIELGTKCTYCRKHGCHEAYYEISLLYFELSKFSLAKQYIEDAIKIKSKEKYTELLAEIEKSL